MFKNRFALIAAVLFILVVSLAVSGSSSDTVRSADLSWPPRPVIIPVTGVDELSDYYQRHSERSASAGHSVEMSDYFIRHPEFRLVTESIDTNQSSSPIDECFDVSVSEVAACREASQSLSE